VSSEEGEFGHSVALSSDDNTALIGGRSDNPSSGAQPATCGTLDSRAQHRSIAAGAADCPALSRD